MFKKVLIANRGEIAIRIMRACRELDVSTVAVYSDADKNALFPKYADEAYHIGPSPSSQSYLNMDKIIEVAKESGAEGIHPGYGFLSENPVFAKKCKAAGIVFIGPSSEVIEKMGSKIAARKLMVEAGVPVVPGYDKAIEDVDEALEMADSIGYPVMIKASAGGGGIGMKVVYSKDDFKSSLVSIQSVAQSAFGDPTVFIEKYVEEPRHIEFQILATATPAMRVKRGAYAGTTFGLRITDIQTPPLGDTQCPPLRPRPLSCISAITTEPSSDSGPIFFATSLVESTFIEIPNIPPDDTRVKTIHYLRRIKFVGR